MLINIDGHNVTVPQPVTRILRKQPGYSRYGVDAKPQEHRLSSTSDGGLRLFCRVGTKYLDGSLADITDRRVIDWYNATHCD